MLDLAAGAGGKALALAADMGNLGEIIASDIHAARLLQIGQPRRPRRASRSSAHRRICRKAPSTSCSWTRPAAARAPGGGSRNRNGGSRPTRLAELAALQDQLLDTGAARVRPGGRLVYATCSLLALENDDRIDAFRARHPEFTLLRADEAWDGADMPGMGEFFRATPATTGTDGFFAAILERHANSVGMRE